MNVFSQNAPWFVIGPLMGLVVTGMFALTNRPIGASGSYAQVTDKILGKTVKEPWRVIFMIGVILGGLLVGWLSAGLTAPLSYGMLGEKLGKIALVLLLLVCGILMGYGARWMGGCTSGHGLCGTSMRSPGSFVATGTFFVTAVCVTYILHWITGGFI